MTCAQLRESGVTEAALRWHAGRGWRVLLPGVFLMTRDAPRTRQRLVGRAPLGRERSALSGPAPPPHCTASPRPIPADGCTCSFRRPWPVVGAVLLRSGAPCSTTTTSARADLFACRHQREPLCDAARVARTVDARSAILIEAVQRELTTIDDLADWVHRLRPRDAAALRLPLEAAASGAWSVPEAELLDLVATSRVLPDAWANPGLSTADGRPLTTPDVLVRRRRHGGHGALAALPLLAGRLGRHRRRRR